MASTSSFPFIPEESDDVFISFRGEDTRHTFTAHLLAALGRLKIRTYVDYKLGRGDEISPTLLRAIEESKASVVVLSQNYATSKWCLEELVKIMECRRTKGQIVVPVFYHVDPSDVRNQTGTYAEAFAKHEQRFKENMQKVQSWRTSLREVANLSGWDCLVNRIESELVEKIAEDILRKLSSVQDPEIDREIERAQQLALLKAQKMSHGCEPGDLEELAAAYNYIAQLSSKKLENLLLRRFS
ncbi:toll/interleukin-1 receptor-like protein [Cajanus cajan]|uniref:toll/interleukin-1 receptor-like protein n=1 Tax=Cajanus cajan TaxID=3821 RepID=UPI00098D96AC|nr:toll/interleukin-1 receptor-like protein [Cajanus cajan]